MSDLIDTGLSLEAEIYPRDDGTCEIVTFALGITAGAIMTVQEGPNGEPQLLLRLSDMDFTTAAQMFQMLGENIERQLRATGEWDDEDDPEATR